MAFSTAMGRRGYKKADVDNFLEDFELELATLIAGEHSAMTTADLHRRRRNLGRGRLQSYNPDEVDAFFDLCEAELERVREGQNTAPPTTQHEPGPAAAPSQTSALRVRSANELRAAYLPPADQHEPGYAAKPVEQLLERMAAALDDRDTLSSGQLEASRPKSGSGYRADAVDRLIQGVANELHQRGR